VEEHRSTWQSWHVPAEAPSPIRAVEIASDKVDQLVELLISAVLQPLRSAHLPPETRSISLTQPDDGISDPAALRRVDSSSVYTVARSELFTRILAADQRLIAAAGRTKRAGRDGRNRGAGAASQYRLYVPDLIDEDLQPVREVRGRRLSKAGSGSPFLPR
jgi:hypothetical protein